MKQNQKQAAIGFIFITMLIDITGWGIIIPVIPKLIKGNPHVLDFPAMDSQIMSGAFSPAGDMLMIGECSGKATLLSSRGDKGVPPQPFEVDISEVAGRAAQDEAWVVEPVGARAARELVRSGKMEVRGDTAWATGL